MLNQVLKVSSATCQQFVEDAKKSNIFVFSKFTLISELLNVEEGHVMPLKSGPSFKVVEDVTVRVSFSCSIVNMTVTGTAGITSSLCLPHYLFI